MNTNHRLIGLIWTFCSTMAANAQTRETVNYFSAIKNHDLSELYRTDSIQGEDEADKMPFPEPLGYIGSNYQRFYIHYITVTKSKDNPYQYKVYGKTKVKENICSFSGTITVTKAVLYKENFDPRYKEGSMSCEVVFYEDSTQTSSGMIKGRVLTDFYLDKKGKLHYDALMIVGDGYCNNQCSATWRSYKTHNIKRCNWGDFRMPDSRDLDKGAGDVSIDEKYVKNGWKTFVAAYNGDEKTANQARQIEDAEWWK